MTIMFLVARVLAWAEFFQEKADRLADKPHLFDYFLRYEGYADEMRDYAEMLQDGKFSVFEAIYSCRTEFLSDPVTPAIMAERASLQKVYA